MLIGYARTSTVDQIAGFEAQVAALGAANVEDGQVYKEQVSAMQERPQLDSAIQFARQGDTLVVTKLDRLARSVKDLLAIIDRLEAKGVALRILDFGGSAVDTKGPTGKLLLTLVGAIGEFERAMMLERQRIGIAAARAEGKFKGRTPSARRQAPDILERKAKGEKPIAIARALGISRASVFRVLKAATASH
jgi:DNA invertase Pin-like site-specific DNA recombinase